MDSGICQTSTASPAEPGDTYWFWLCGSKANGPGKPLRLVAGGADIVL